MKGVFDSENISDDCQKILIQRKHHGRWSIAPNRVLSELWLQILRFYVLFQSLN